MLDRDSKFRVAGVAFLAVAVMAGVVASALVSKSHAQGASGASGRPKGSTGLRPPGRPRAEHEIPEDCRADPSHPPRIRFEGLADARLFDVGPVKQGVQVEREVTVRNAGTGDLCIVDVSAGCGCVKVSMAGPSRVPPGGTTKVRFVVHTDGREGEVKKDVSVWSNDLERRESKFTVRVDVRLGLVLENKPQIYFGRHAVGVPGTDVLRLRSPRSDGAWAVTAVTGARAAYTFVTKDVEPEDPEFRHVEVTITHPGHEKAEYLDDQVTITTTHPDRPSIVLRSQMLVLDRFYASPQRIPFGFVGGKTPPLQRQAYVMSAEPDVPFTLKRAHVEGAGFEAGEPQKSPQGWVVDLRYDGQSRAAGTLLEAKLVLEVDEPGVAPITIPITATVR